MPGPLMEIHCSTELSGGILLKLWTSLSMVARILAQKTLTVIHYFTELSGENLLKSYEFWSMQTRTLMP